MERDPEALVVEVVYASPARQRVVSVPLTEGLTVLEAVRNSGILEDAPELVTGELALGIWGRRVNASQRLRADDRVEIFRPLQCDPREARRQAAGAGAGRGKRGSAPRTPS
jgi:putative ubiquitin-RnfH superfamily antitoxin RatB of RatAB toxin-antitoxin module